jgi:serine/threonine-protein kinase SRPK3
VESDIKLDNIQLTLPDEQDSYLDTFCATEKSTPSFSKYGKGETPVFTSHEMQQDQLGYPILCDLGSAVFDEVKYPAVVQALPYRAPEVILGAAWDHKIDVWNFGVLVSLETMTLGERY